MSYSGCRMLSGLILTLFAANTIARGQSTVLNIPSTKVMPRNQLYIEADFISHATSFKDGGFLWYGPSLIYGIGGNVELGVNAYVIKDGGTASSFEVQPNVKWKFFDSEDKGVSVSAGAMLFLPLPYRNETNTAGMFYTVLAKKVNKEFGPRITSGVYRLVGERDGTKSKTGPLAGYEQPLGRRLTFMADWYGGKNHLGYAAVGLGFTVTKTTSLYASYNFGNEGRGNNWLAIYYGFTF